MITPQRHCAVQRFLLEIQKFGINSAHVSHATSTWSDEDWVELLVQATLTQEPEFVGALMGQRCSADNATAALNQCAARIGTEGAGKELSWPRAVGMMLLSKGALPGQNVFSVMWALQCLSASPNVAGHVHTWVARNTQPPQFWWPLTQMANRTTNAPVLAVLPIAELWSTGGAPLIIEEARHALSMSKASVRSQAWVDCLSVLMNRCSGLADCLVDMALAAADNQVDPVKNKALPIIDWLEIGQDRWGDLLSDRVCQDVGRFLRRKKVSIPDSLTQRLDKMELERSVVSPKMGAPTLKM